jgi:hypothetical protein
VKITAYNQHTLAPSPEPWSVLSQTNVPRTIEPTSL